MPTTCDDFRAKHKPDVKFAELPGVVREWLIGHYMSCAACRLFIALLRPEDQDNSFDGEELARKDAKEFLMNDIALKMQEIVLKQGNG